MKAVVLYKPGNAENLIIEERPVPVPKEGQVLIKVKAFGLNRSELMTRKGLSPNVKFPRVLGIECVGEVEEDPSGIFEQGQQVAAVMGEMGRAYDGSYAEYTVLPKEIVVSFQSKLDRSTLGAIPEMFHTVSGSLNLALKIAKGETLLVRGGTSSIGMLAVQYAKTNGLTVIATTRKQEKIKTILENGADYALVDDGNLSDQVRKIFPNGVNKVLELVGTSTLQDSLQCAAQGGSVCFTGMLSEQWSIKDFAPMDYIPSTVNLTVYNSGDVRMDKDHFQTFGEDVEAGKIKLNISKIFSLDEIVAAHQYMESNRGSGKIVVVNE